ncbi:alpha/beta hydrolase fold domain-containing protein [Aporhodopirellula aestuarii]|uniref:Alpha/beta hydrolase n=1 Tax=Aporhodopirellula aestuarii TaxID=2950107 RepID=A0ABT0U882_9BACT|nr:alpha/beta hydrolase [Aporhodopirellula aestuarii]MCM2372996.1 alpha/beta hydrolase [Aporhodopirellula aestuarii]
MAEESASPDIKTYWDIRYSSSPELQEGKSGLADLYLPIFPDDTVSDASHESEECLASSSQQAPVRVTGRLRPAVVVVHGGGWLVGDKWSLGSYSEQLAEMGFCVLNINYRLAPYSKFPAQVDDVRHALLYLADNADELSIDPQRIGMFGYSAGGHLSALVGVMSDETDETQATSSDWAIDDPRWKRLPKIAAVCAGGPPCDLRLLPIDSEALSFFLHGSRRQFPEIYVAASPTAHVSAGDPPTQLIHGEKDLIVPIESSQGFADALKAVGVSVALTVIKDQGHLVTFMHPRTQKQVRDFFSEQLLQRAP